MLARPGIERQFFGHPANRLLYTPPVYFEVFIAIIIIIIIIIINIIIIIIIYSYIIQNKYILTVECRSYVTQIADCTCSSVCNLAISSNEKYINKNEMFFQGEKLDARKIRLS